MSKKETLNLSDDAIIMIRELVQLAIFTNTPIDGHLRTLELESHDGKLVPSEEYVSAYNETIEKLEKEAEEKIAEMTGVGTEEESFSLEGLKDKHGAVDVLLPSEDEKTYN